MQNKFSKSILTYITLGILGFWSKNTDAQISLAATGGTLAANYTTMEAAFTAINAGTHTGTITISVTGNTTETISAVLNASGSGAASYTSIGISPSGGATRTISGSIAGALIDLNGADNVTINGINAGGDALVIDNQDISTTSSTIRFINDASTNMVQNCTVLGASSALTTGTIVFSTADATLLAGNDDNTISNCTIDASGANFPSTAILCNGNAVAGQENSGILINNNNIANFFSAAIVSSGISVSAGGTSWTITNNKFYQAAIRTYTTANTHKGIRVASGAAHTISNNTIGFANAAGTGTYAMTATNATRFIAIDLALAVGGTTTSVQGNVISGISLGTSSGAALTNGIICGINITSGNVEVGNIVGNTIGAATGTGSIVATPTTSQGAIVGINSSSTGTILIQNNTIGSLTSSGATAAVAGGIIGVNISGIATSMTITNNIIGNTTADNMRGGTSGLTTGSSIVSGINLPSTPVLTTISNNTIQNLASYGSGTAGYVRGIWTQAATGSTASYTITNNTINNLSTNTGLTTITSGQAGALGINLSIGSNGVVSNNTISNISRTNTGTISGFCVGITSANATSSTITKNKIYNISNASTATSVTAPGIAAGIIIRSGTTDVTVSNNMISLGNGQTTNTCFIGIQGNHGSTPDPIDKIYYNTINIEGTAAAGAQPSFGILRGDLSATARNQTIDIRNNIFNNTRTGGTGQHFAIANNYGSTASNTGWAANASNFNVLNASAATIGHWTSALNFANWKTNSASDNSSLSAVSVPFVNTATGDLHMNYGLTATALESGGTTIASITVDYDNQSRPGPVGSVNGGGTMPDIGADEFDGVYLDITAPAISYTSLSFTCQTTDRTFTATITDITGVPTSGALQPRVYYRKNAGAWFSSQGVLTSGTGANGTWTFTIVAADMGGLAITDNITYFVIAQDLAASPNIGSNPGGGLVATDVNTVATAPTTPNNYNISPTISGTYTVGATGTFTTLTAAVFAYNNSCLGGPVVFSLIDATYPGETFPITINSNAYSSATNTLTIMPAGGVSPTFSGSTTTAIILLNGADYVTIDGGDGTGTNSICPRSNAGRAMTIAQTNTSTAAGVVSLQTTAGGDAATNNKVMNCNIIGNANTTTLVGINIGGTVIGSGTGATGNNGNQIINNSIRQSVVGIFSAGGTTKNTNNVFDLNDMTGTGTAALGRVGVALVFEDNVSVQGNKIANIIFTGSNDVIAITLGSVSASNSLTAGSEVTNATIAYNMIDNLVQSATFSSVGINMAAASTGTTTIANNTITNVFANGTGGDFAGGIYYGGGAGTLRVYYNTIHITGATLTGASQPNFALGINGTSPNVDIQNNILMCTGENGANANTGIGLAYTSTVGNYANLISNNNNIFVSGTTGAVIGRVGGLAGGTTKVTLVDWQTETGRDLNSQNINPAFVSASDWHLDAANSINGSLLCGAASISVTSDYACQTRSSTPTIGAYENPLAPASITLAEVSGNTNNDGTLCIGAMLTLTASSGTNYMWSGPNGFTSTNGAPSISNIALADAGTYMVTVTNGTCITTGSTMITVNDAPTATSTPTDINCFGANDGMVTSNITGGSTPYTFLWSNGATTSSITGLSTGTYSLTATDANNCATSTSMVTITEPSLLSGTATANDVSCNGGNDASVDLVASGGTPTYNFSWSNGITSEDLTGLQAGVYDVTVTDNLGCMTMTSVTISEPTASSVTATGNDALCFGASNGDATAVAMGGTGAFTYMWSNSATDAMITGLVAGSYTVTATDANGCEVVTSLTISEPTALDATALTDNDASCMGCPDGAASVNATGGTVGYSFMWSNSETTATISGLVAGMYYVTTTDANGCMDIDSTEISEPTSLITTSNTLNQISVYPNPTSEVIYVENIPVDARLRLMNALGQVVFERTNINQNNIMVDMKELPAAGYWIEIQSNNARVTKLVVKRE